MAKTITYNVVSDTTQAVKSQENLTDSIEDTGDAMKDTKKETADYGGVIDKLTGGMASSFKGAIKGVKGLGKGFKGLRGLAMATGIGALVLLVTAAVEWFSNFDAAIRLASQAMDAIGGAVNQLGKSFDLLLKGDFSGAADAFTDVGNAALKAAENAGELYDVNVKLQELQAKNIPLNAQLRQDLELQKKILEDTTLSEKERLAALENVSALSAQIQQNAIDENKLKQKSLELAIANENNDQKRRELNIELSQTQAELIGQEGQLNIIRKDAEKVEREILTIARQKRIDQLAEEVRLNEELKALLKEDIEEDTSMDDLSDADKMFMNADENNKRSIFSKEQTNDALLKLDKDLSDDQAEIRANDLKIAQAKADAEQQLNAAVGGSLVALTNLAASGSKTQKALALAQIAFSTGSSIAAAIRNANSPTPDNIATGGLAGIAKAAAIVGSILTGVASAKRVIGSAPKVPQMNGGGGGGGGGVGGGGSFSGKLSGGGANNFFPTQIGAIPQNVPDVNVQNLNNTPPRAYIVASDIADSTRAQEILKQKSTL